MALIPERTPSTEFLRARWLIAAPDALHSGGGVLVSRGRVRALATTPGECRRARREAGERVLDLGAGVLAPGLVNAHAHLELGGLEGRVGTGEFRPWVERLIVLRGARSQSELVADARAGADRLLATGTTTVGDIDSSGAGLAALRDHPLRARLYREVLDAADPSRTNSSLERIEAALPTTDRLTEGISPHAPHTVSPELFAALGKLASQRGVPVTIHWAETPAEDEWMRFASGAFQGMVQRSPGRSGLDVIEDAGLLCRTTSLVHGNHPGPGERDRIARAGATLVHCPGSHRFFGRPPFDWAAWRDAGVTLALGTDSLASNDALDMRREMALVRESCPEITPGEVFAAATIGGARAVDLSGQVGTLAPGHWADICLFRVAAEDPATCLDELTRGLPVLERSWIQGAPASQMTS